MTQLTLYKTENQDGEYSCGDIGITSDEWFDLLSDKGANQYLNALLCFLREPDNTGSCTNVALKYGKTAQHYNAKIRHFSQWIEKKLNRFQVVGTDDSDTFWCIAMEKGWKTKDGFVWLLRPELIEALRTFLMKQLVNEYRTREPFNGYEEEYKWQLLDTTDGQSAIDIVKSLRNQNIVDNPRVDGVLKKLWEENPNELSLCINGLLDESKPIDERIAAFKTDMRAICPNEWKNAANDERTAAAILTCKYPDKYTFYKDEVYQTVCQYFGINRHNTGQKFSHFIEIINTLTQKYGKEIQELMIPQIGKYNIKPLNLAVQTLFWCLKDYMINSMKREKRNYWLVGYSFGSNNSQFDRFIKESVWECWFSDDSKGDQNQLSLAQTIQTGDVLILKSACTKGTNHDIPFLRVKAVGIVETDIEINKNNGKSFCSCKVSYSGIQDHDFDDAALSSVRKTIHYCNTDAKTQTVIDYANSILNLNNAENMECQKYITLLEKTHNLILTGAPGTGKTYLANEIAKAMKAEVEFVQFHPSYDYTDFVEGLRPIQEGDGKVGFERKDGVFKVFCAKALENLLDSQKSLQTLQQEISVRDKIYAFVQKSIDENTQFETQGTKNKFHIIDSKPKSIVIEIPNNEKSRVISLQKSDLVTLLEKNVQISNSGDIQPYFQRKYRTQQDSYTFVLYNILRNTKNEVKQVSLVERKNFVFIIDEINRGEISKIFGELFFSIDPGYRGVKGKVQTQYANMETEPNDFDEALGEKEIFGHFFVPENVYIIGTMNDIDRSVESMDFAMRRRFAWKEVTAKDSMQMLDGLVNVDEMKARMENINDEILRTPGLGKAYQIGAAYFKKYELYNDFDLLWEYHLEGLLFEYLRGTTDIDKTMKKLADAYGYTKSNKYEPTSNN